MQPHAAERRHLERQIAYARPIFMVLALVDLLDRPPVERGPNAVLFVTVYLLVALILALAQNLQRIGDWLRLPLPVDLVALAGVFGLDPVGRSLLVRLPVCGAGFRDSLGHAPFGDPRRNRHAGGSGSNCDDRTAGFGTDGVLDRTLRRHLRCGRRHSVFRQPPAAPRHGTGVSGAGYRAVGDGVSGMAESLRLVLGELVRAFNAKRRYWHIAIPKSIVSLSGNCTPATNRA